ncbi:MAG TPA: signal peptidase I [Actinomycetota bacterium]
MTDPVGADERTGARTGAEPAPAAPERRDAGFWRELPVLIVAALLIAILIKTFLVQAFYIPSPSMEPTLVRGDRVLVCRICTRLGGVSRGDVIVFADPDPAPHEDDWFVRDALRWLAEGIGVAQPEDEDFIKRVIGLPGDVVEIRRGAVFVNGEPLDEPYLHRRADTRSFGLRTVPDGMLFVMGDNRLVSGDSRFPPPTGVGLVPEDRVIGVAFVRVWPPPRWGGI